MRLFALFAVAGVALTQEPAPPPPTVAVGTMSALMVEIIYPTSNAIFYVQKDGPPKTEAEWAAMQAKALMLAESANLLMLPGRARDDKWIADAKLLLDAGTAAYKAARSKSVAGLSAVSDALNTSCVTCHVDYRPEFRKYPTL